jgi:hypothetical protein
MISETDLASKPRCNHLPSIHTYVLRHSVRLSQLGLGVKKEEKTLNIQQIIIDPVFNSSAVLQR